MIKTFDELANWCRGVEDGLGDPSAACGHAFFEFRRSNVATLNDLLCCAFSEQDGLLLQIRAHAEALPLPVKMGACEVGREGVDNYGLHLIAPGLWAVEPSLNIQSLLHVFVTLYGVPDPAPWEKRIVFAR